MEKMNIQDIIKIPDDYYILSEPKLNITKAIKQGLTDKNLSVRKLADKMQMKHPQIVRVTSCENYTINTLLRILNELDLELVIRPKSKHIN